MQTRIIVEFYIQPVFNAYTLMKTRSYCFWKLKFLSTKKPSPSCNREMVLLKQFTLQIRNLLMDNHFFTTKPSIRSITSSGACVLRGMFENRSLQHAMHTVLLFFLHLLYLWCVYQPLCLSSRSWLLATTKYATRSCTLLHSYTQRAQRTEDWAGRW